jgi:hypothetical protein
MSYNLTLTDGVTTITIPDGAEDTSTTLTLFGKNYAAYGVPLNENFIYLLQNSAFSSPPLHPVTGELWWDTINRQMNVWDGTKWKVASGPSIGISSPVPNNAGDLWWDSANGQLKAWNGTAWTLVGPLANINQGISGPSVITVQDTGGTYHTVLALNASNRTIAVISGDSTFTTSAITGFSTIKPGFNLPEAIGTYYGNAENALSVVGINGANFLRSDVISTTNNQFIVNTNDGLVIGAEADLAINVENGGVNFVGQTANRNMEFFVSLPSGARTSSLFINAANGSVLVRQNPTSDPMCVVNKGYVDTAVQNLSSSLLHADGSVALSGNLVPSGTVTLGTTSNPFTSIYGSSVNGGSAIFTNGSFNTLSVTSSPTLTTSVANKTYVDSSISGSAATLTTDRQNAILALINNAPNNLNNLGAIAIAINNDPAFSTTLANQINLLAPKQNPIFTGYPQAPTQPLTDSSTNIATTAFVAAALTAAGIATGSSLNSTLSNYAPLSNPAFIGSPTSVTPPDGSANTRIATTQFVANAVAISNSTVTTQVGTQLSKYALLSNPNFTGYPTIQTPIDTTDNSTKIATTAYVSAKISSLSTQTTNSPTFTGTMTVDSLAVNNGPIIIKAGGIVTTTDLALDIGSSTNRFRNIYGNAMTASYADLAELYVADDQYEPGTVLDFGGNFEVTIGLTPESRRIAGVVSTNPAYLMNDGLKGEFVAAVALQGRCPCKVMGNVRVGDMLVSAGGGMAMTSDDPKVGSVLGKALSDFTGDFGVVEVAVGKC